MKGSRGRIKDATKGVGIRSKCHSCRHKAHALIDRALMAGEPAWQIGHRYGIAASSINYHRKNHLTERLRTAAMKRRGSEDDSLLDELLRELEDIRIETKKILRDARKAKDRNVALGAIVSLYKYIEMKARLRPVTLPKESQKISISFNTDGHILVKQGESGDDPAPSEPIETTATSTPTRPALPPMSEAAKPKPDPPKAAAPRQREVIDNRKHFAPAPEPKPSALGPLKPPKPPPRPVEERRPGWSQRDQEFFSDPTERDAAEDEANANSDDPKRWPV